MDRISPQIDSARRKTVGKESLLALDPSNLRIQQLSHKEFSKSGDALSPSLTGRIEKMEARLEIHHDELDTHGEEITKLKEQQEQLIATIEKLKKEIVAPPVQPSTAGRPMQLTNDGTSCFINGPFQLLMNEEFLLVPLLDYLSNWVQNEVAVEYLEAVQRLYCEFDYLPVKMTYINECMIGPVFYKATWGLHTSFAGNIHASILFLDSYKNINRVLEKRPEFKYFYEAVHSYQYPNNRQGDAPVVLTNLRQLMPQGNRNGQQDSLEWLRSILNWIDVSKTPQCCFKLETTRTYQPYSERDPQQLQRLEQCDRNVIDNFPISGRRVGSSFGYELQIPLPNADGVALDGQTLINGYFTANKHEPIIFKNPGTQEPALYEIASETRHITQHPSGLLITLMRFQQGHKNNIQVTMSKHLTIDGARYEITTIIRHDGTFEKGHYWTLVKKRDGWWLCDDQREIRPAKSEELKDAFDYGYSYFVRYCSSSGCPVM